MDERLVEADATAAVGALGRAFPAAGIVGLVAVDLRGAGGANFDERGSGSSALRFIPCERGFRSVVEGTFRGPRLVLRTSVLTVEEVTGGDTVEETWGIGDGLPVSMDERTESRNWHDYQ